MAPTLTPKHRPGRSGGDIKKTAIVWTTEKREVKHLRNWESNPRRFTAKGMADLEASIMRLGYIDPIAINTDGTIIGGHARKETLLRLGLKEIDVRVPSRPLSDQEVREAVIRLNKNQAGEWDFDALSSAFDQSELLDWGFTPQEIGVFEPATAADQGGLDTLKPKGRITCPECGHDFTR